MRERVWSSLLGPTTPVSIADAGARLRGARSILLVRVEGTVSELLAATPVIANLRAYLPGTRIRFLAGAGNADAVRDHPALERVTSAPRRGISLPATALLVARKLGSEEPDVALVLSTATPHPLGLAAARRCRTRLLAGFDDASHGTSWARLAYDCIVPGPGEARVHAVDVHLSLLEALGVPIVDRRHCLAVTPEQRNRGHALLEGAGIDPARPVLGIHPGGFPRSPQRQWPPSHYAVILQRAAKELGYQPLLLGRNVDRETLEQVRALGRSPIPSLLDLPFADRKGVMASLDYFVSHDGEPVHVAAGLGVPSFFVFLSTPAWRWAPYGSHVSVWEESGEIPGAAEVWKRMVPLLEAASGRDKTA